MPSPPHKNNAITPSIANSNARLPATLPIMNAVVVFCWSCCTGLLSTVWALIFASVGILVLMGDIAAVTFLGVGDAVVVVVVNAAVPFL